MELVNKAGLFVAFILFTILSLGIMNSSASTITIGKSDNGEMEQTTNDPLAEGMPEAEYEIENGEYSAKQKKPIMEMAIVADKEFGDTFHHDMIKITNYVDTLMRDVHNRFKTLPNSSISFRVTSVTPIQRVEDQPFIEDARQGGVGGKVDLNKALELFGKWMHKKKESLPKFDVAMAIISSTFNNVIGVGYLRGLCNLDHDGQDVTSSLVVTLRENISPAATVAHEIGHVLGADHDDEYNEEYYYSSICTFNSTEHFIMDKFSVENEFYFSACSDAQIWDAVSSEDGECLRRLDSNSSIIDTSSSSSVGIMRPPGVSMIDQCLIFQNLSVNLAFNENEEPCGFLSKCVSSSDSGNSSLNWGFNLNPLDGTHCGDNMRCFRGKCLDAGVQLENVAVERCLTTSDHFEAFDTPTMGICSELVTPLDMLIVEDLDIFGKLLKMPYTSQEKGGNATKCLALYHTNEEGFYLTFEECSNKEDFDNVTKAWFGWQFTKVSNDEYQLIHNGFRNICLRVSDDSYEVVASTNCSAEDNATRWRVRANNGTMLNNLGSSPEIEKNVTLISSCIKVTCFVVLIMWCLIKIILYILRRLVNYDCGLSKFYWLTLISN